MTGPGGPEGRKAAEQTRRPLRVAFWGTYDLGKPRNRILIQGLRENGVEVIECNVHVWEGVEDKSRLRAWRLLRVLRWWAAYPGLAWRYLRLPRHDLVLVGYLGQLDVFLIRILAWLRRVPLVWDVFLSLHHTVVDDRALLGRRHLAARLLYAWEWLALRVPDLMLMDTDAQGDLLTERFGVRRERIATVFVGAEDRAFSAPPPRPEPRPTGPYRVLFYGQFIPFHGLETIVEAARLCADDDIVWRIIGQGQQTPLFRRLLEEGPPLARLEWTRWVPYEQLIDELHDADLCLGVFGKGDKTSRVIPNKVFQILAAGRALITGDSPAIRELLSPGPGVVLVPLGDARALADAIETMRRRRPDEVAADMDRYRALVTPAAVCRPLVGVLRARSGLSPAAGATNPASR